MSKISIKIGELEFSAEGTEKFVEKSIVSLKKELLAGKEIGPAPAKTQKISNINIKERNVKSGEITLLDFFKEKKPSTHYDKIAVFGYYLKQYAGKKIFKEEDVENYYQELIGLTKLPGNLKVTLQDTIRHTGYIKRTARGAYELSSTGINHVTHELPRGTE